MAKQSSQLEPPDRRQEQAATDRDHPAADDVLAFIGETPEGVYAVDSNHNIVLWNPGAERILGYSAEEAVGRSCFDMIGGRDDKGHIVCQGGCGDMMLATAGLLIPSRDLVFYSKERQAVPVTVTNILLASDGLSPATVVHLFRPRPTTPHLEMASIAPSQDTGAALAAQRRESRQVKRILSARERDVLTLLRDGAGSAAIATQLGISQGTA